MNTLLSKSWQLLSRQFLVFFTIALSSQLLLTVLTYLFTPVDGQTFNEVLMNLIEHPEQAALIAQTHYLYIILLFLVFCIDIICGTFIVYTVTHPDESLRSIISHTLSYIPRTLITSTIVGLITLVGLLIFIVPGLIAICFFTFASPLLIVARNLSIREALMTSAIITQKHFTQVALLLLSVMLASNILITVWYAFTTSVANLPGAQVIVSLVAQLITLFATSVIAHGGLHLMNKKQENPEV